MANPVIVGNGSIKYVFEVGDAPVILTGSNDSGTSTVLADQTGALYTVPLGRKFVCLTLALGTMSAAQVVTVSLSGGGNVFRAQIVGFFDDLPQASRVEVVIDATSNPPRQLYREDLRHLGRGYSLSALGAESEENRSATTGRDIQPQRR